MSKDTEQFSDIDKILEEFSSYIEELPVAKPQAPREAKKPKPQETVKPETKAEKDPRPAPAPPIIKAAAEDPFLIDLDMPTAPAVAPVQPSASSARPAAPRPAPRTAQPPRVSPASRFSSEDFEAAFAPNTGRTRTAQAKKAPPVTPPPAPRAPKENTQRPQKRESGGERVATGFLGIVFALLSVIALAWVALNVHPSSNSAAVSDSRLDLVSKLDVYMNNAAADALGDLAYIKKIYKIDENDTSAPMPDAAKYGTVSIQDAAKVLDVIQQARDSGLLEDQEVIFSPDIDFYHDSDIQYYCDDTILVICWKELIDGNTCSCVEVKIADASQFRRKIADDTYGSSNQYYASTMYKQVNAVVAMNADFYQFRSFGIVAYQRQLYRFDAAAYTGAYSQYNCIDNCFVTADGKFLFMHKGEQTTAEAVEQFMADNNVLFTIAFGPILVEDGVVQTCDWYPAGQPNTGYSRAGIGEFDDLHYFYMSLNHSNEKAARWTVNQFAQHIAEKGVVNAYGLDGGQTSEIVFQGQPYNYIDFNAERLVSDIIYFATAIPSEEVSP